MWEDNRKQRLILNIILVVIILAIIAALGKAMLYVGRQTQEHDEQLSEIYVQQQQQQAEARQESVDAIQLEYEKDMQTVADYLPGIVVWGDNTTAAVSGTLNYPFVLQTYLNTYLCDIYDFSSTIENARDYARLDWSKYTLNIPVVNMASGKESTYTIMGRAGVDPYVLSEDLVIPAEVENVDIHFTSTEGKTVTPLTGGDMGVNNVRIGGIEGKLSLDAEDYINSGRLHYLFTRLEPGQEVTIPTGTAIETASENLYKDYIHVVLVGMYGDYNNGNDLVRQVKTLLARQTQNSERFIVLGPYTHNIYSSSSSAMNAVDDAMLQAFGNRYISIRRYLIGDGYTDAGISPSSQDTYYISQEIIPPSFRAASQSEELNSLAHRLIGKLVYTRMENLGYFDEVFDELGIRASTQQLLKTDPSYFDRTIQNALK